MTRASAKTLSKVRAVAVNMVSNPNLIRTEFQDFVTSLRPGIAENRDKDDLGIII